MHLMVNLVVSIQVPNIIQGSPQQISSYVKDSLCVYGTTCNIYI
jgi:hypothetical protein